MYVIQFRSVKVDPEICVLTLRSITVDYIEQNWNSYRSARTGLDGISAPEPKDEWLSGMRRPTIWADHICVHALSCRLLLQFLIVKDGVDDIFVVPSAESPFQLITLCLQEESHYEAAVRP